MATTAQTWSEEIVEAAGGPVLLAKGCQGGSPLMIPFDSSEIANWADKPDAQHLSHVPQRVFIFLMRTSATRTPTFGSHFSRSAGNKG